MFYLTLVNKPLWQTSQKRKLSYRQIWQSVRLCNNMHLEYMATLGKNGFKSGKNQILVLGLQSWDGSSLCLTWPARLITNTESGLCSTRLSLLEGLKCQASIGLTHHYFDLKLDWIKISTIKTNFAPCDFVNLFKNRTLKLSCKALNMKSSLFDISILTIASLLIVYISCAFLQVKNPI